VLAEGLPGKSVERGMAMKDRILKTNSPSTHRSCLKPNQVNVLANLAVSGILKFCLLFVITISLIVGCASLPKDYPRTPSTAFQDHASTLIGKQMEELAAAHPGKSGFSIIRYPRPAFTSRIMFADLAQKSLDMQYYIWEADATGRVLAQRLVRAADRGVRVRILVDDINLSGRDAIVASMDAHPNIEIRIFNPFAQRSARIFGFLTDMNRVNHRMHNKVIVMDNTLAIVGGRNIGDIYFGVNTVANYRDLDIAAAGPVVRDISGVFDIFWNGDWSVPIAALVDRPYTEKDLRETMARMEQKIAESNYPHPLDQDVADLESELASISDNLVWAPGRIIWDDPAAIYDENAGGNIHRAFFKKMETVRKEILAESAYFVARERGVETIGKLHERGVRVRMLTNSLATNDVLAAHAGYSKYRAEMIKNGLELYELRPDAGLAQRSVKQSIISSQSKASLHTKALVFDRESVFIGSFNLDPRSADINTEAGLYVESPKLAGQVVEYMDEGVKPQNSYHVLLDENGDLVWVTEIDGKEVRYSTDPESSFWQRFKAGLIRILPVQGQL